MTAPERATLFLRPLREGRGGGFEPPWTEVSCAHEPSPGVGCGPVWDEVEWLRAGGGAWLVRVEEPPRRSTALVVRSGVVSVMMRMKTRKVRRTMSKLGVDAITWWESQVDPSQVLLAPRMSSVVRVLGCVAVARLASAHIDDANTRERVTAMLDHAEACDGVIDCDCEVQTSAILDDAEDRARKAYERATTASPCDADVAMHRRTSADSAAARAAWFAIRSACDKNSVPEVCRIVDNALILLGSAGDTTTRCLDAARLAIGDLWFLSLPAKQWLRR